jgi:O-antigen/teichoic acid export membrane protein
MGDGRVIARNTYFLTLAHGASKVCSVGLTAIAGRVLGTAGYGIYATGSTLVEVARIFANSGLDYLVTREVATDPDSASRVASAAAAVKLVTGALAYVVLAGLVVLLRYPPGVLPVVLVLGSALFFENLSDIGDAVLQGRERMEYTARALAVAGLVLFVTGALALRGGLGLLGFVGAMVAGYIARWLMVTAAVRHQFADLHLREVRAAEVRRLAHAGAPLLGSTLITLLFHRVDLLMLGKMLPQEQVGLYGAAIRVIDVVVLAPRILATAVYPAVRRSRESGGVAPTVALMAQSTRVALVLCSGIGLAVWVLAPLALRVIPGPAFLPATGALRLLSWGIVLQAGDHMLARLLYAIDREIDFLRIGALGIVCSVTLNLWWIPRLGIEGAAWATVVSYGVTLLLYYGFAARRGYRIPLPTAFLGPALALLAAGLAAVAARHAPPAARSAAMIGAWLAALPLTRALRRQDLAWLAGWLRRPA